MAWRPAPLVGFFLGSGIMFWNITPWTWFEAFLRHGGFSITGWFTMENPKITWAWFGIMSHWKLKGKPQQLYGKPILILSFSTKTSKFRGETLKKSCLRKPYFPHTKKKTNLKQTQNFEWVHRYRIKTRRGPYQPALASHCSVVATQKGSAIP